MSGKSGRYSLIILLLLGLAGQAMAIKIMLYPSGGGEKNGGFDSEQPDTLRYDDNGYFYLFGIETDLWGIVRFTAPADFELRCCYLQMLNPNGVSNGVEVTVYDDNGSGEPGNILSGHYNFDGLIDLYAIGVVAPADDLWELTDRRSGRQRTIVAFVGF